MYSTSHSGHRRVQSEERITLTDGLLKKNGLDPVWWTRSEGRIQCPEWDQAKQADARAPTVYGGVQDRRLPGSACAAQGEGVLSGSRFPDRHHLAGRSPALAPALIKARFPRNQAAMITSPLRSAPLAALLQQVREQYRETPGLKLTKPQATRLFGVAPSVCAAMLRALVMENFLSRAGDGLFVRSTTY